MPSGTGTYRRRQDLIGVVVVIALPTGWFRRRLLLFRREESLVPSDEVTDQSCRVFPQAAMMAAWLATGFGAVVAVEQIVAAPAGDEPSFEKIVFRDTGGVSGRGSGRNLSIDSDGTLAAPGKGKLTAEQLAELRKRVGAVDWKTVERKYAIPGGADFFVIQLQATVGGKTYSTAVDDELLRPERAEDAARPAQAAGGTSAIPGRDMETAEGEIRGVLGSSLSAGPGLRKDG